MDTSKNKPGKIQDLIDNKFLEERKIYLWGMVNDKTAKHVIDRLEYLDLMGDGEIQLFINSPGGYVTDGFAIYDTIMSIKSPVSTICTGLAAQYLSLRYPSLQVKLETNKQTLLVKKDLI